MRVIPNATTDAERVGNTILQVIDEVSRLEPIDLPECMYGQDLPLFIGEVIAASGMPTATPKEKRRALRLACSQTGLIAEAIGVEQPG